MANLSTLTTQSFTTRSFWIYVCSSSGALRRLVGALDVSVEGERTTTWFANSVAPLSWHVAAAAVAPLRCAAGTAWIGLVPLECDELEERV